MKTILASASPRRRELLEQMGITFEVRPAKGEEVVTKTIPEEIVQELAYHKAAEIAGLILTEYHIGNKELSREVVRVIGSDTIVVYKGKIFGKPVDDADAQRMLTICRTGECCGTSDQDFCRKDRCDDVSDDEKRDSGIYRKW